LYYPNIKKQDILVFHNNNKECRKVVLGVAIYFSLKDYYDRIGLMDREKMRKFLLVMLEHYGVIKMAEIENKAAVLGELR
jgi:hypothetical protein